MATSLPPFRLLLLRRLTYSRSSGLFIIIGDCLVAHLDHVISFPLVVDPFCRRPPPLMQKILLGMQVAASLAKLAHTQQVVSAYVSSPEHELHHNHHMNRKKSDLQRIPFALVVRCVREPTGTSILALCTVVKLAWDAIACMFAITRFRERFPELWVILQRRGLKVRKAIHVLFRFFQILRVKSSFFHRRQLGFYILVSGIQLEKCTEICCAGR